jgi:hypothetical protein
VYAHLINTDDHAGNMAALGQRRVVLPHSVSAGASTHHEASARLVELPVSLYR